MPDNVFKAEIELSLDEIAAQFGTPYWDEEGDRYYEPPTVGRLIIDSAARQLLETEKELRTELRKRIIAIRDETIHERVAKMIDDQLEATVTETDAFGQPKGEPKTFREILVQKAMEWPTAPHRSSGYPDPRRTNLQNAIEQEIGRVWTKELQAAVKKAKASVLTKVTERAAEVLGKEIVDLAEKQG